jgi:hypothetical protein
MVKKMNITSFNEYWPFFCKEAAERGYNQTEFMQICGLPKTRYNSFDSGAMNLTAYYVSKIIDGLRMTEEYVEKKSQKQFSTEQKDALQRITWSNSNADILSALSKSKTLTKEVRELINKKK